MAEKSVCLGYFTRPYPNELWYGTQSRYKKRTRKTVFDTYIRELYGQRLSLVALNIPPISNLERLVSMLPLGFQLSVEDILLHHTLLPYIMRFISPEHGRRLLEKPNHFLHMIDFDPYLKLCLSCAEEQRKEFGEAFWDRRCQVPHVRYCTIHGIPLTITKIPTMPKNISILPLELETVLKDGLVFNDQGTTEMDPSWYKIAKDSVWLLENTSDWLDVEGQKIQYQRLLATKGYATHNQRLYSQKLSNAVQSFYPSEFLKELNLEIDPIVERNWIQLLITATGRGRYKAPIQHILMLNFLDEDIQHFFETSPHRDPFGTGP